VIVSIVIAILSIFGALSYKQILSFFQNWLRKLLKSIKQLLRPTTSSPLDLHFNSTWEFSSPTQRKKNVCLVICWVPLEHDFKKTYDNVVAAKIVWFIWKKWFIINPQIHLFVFWLSQSSISSMESISLSSQKCYFLKLKKRSRTFQSNLRCIDSSLNKNNLPPFNQYLTFHKQVEFILMQVSNLMA